MSTEVRSPVAAGDGVRYTAVAIALHWIIVAAIVYQLALGWRMGDAEGPARTAILNLHKSVGIVILLLSLARLAWRLANPPPPPHESLTQMERRLSELVHHGFYVGLLGLPLTGWAMISTTRAGGVTRLFGLMPWPRLPLISMLPGKVREFLSGPLELSHTALVWMTLALLALHVIGALKHHFLSMAPVLARMAPGARPGALAEPRLLGIPVFAVIIVAAAYAPSPPPPVAPRPKVAQIAKADLYLDIVAPALARRCGSCHNDDKTRGGLSLVDHEAIMAGGYDGRIVLPGDPAKSELFRRINLPHDHKEFMPISGRVPLTSEQTAAIGVWIESGAPKGGVLIGSIKLKPAQIAALQKALPGGAPAQAGADNFPPPLALPTVAAADTGAVAALEKAGFVVRPMAKASQALSVDFTGQRPLTGEDFTLLLRIAPQIYSLSLRDGSVSDGDLKGLTAMANLARLRLEQNSVTDAGMPILLQLKSLTYLNLVGTQVSDASLAPLASLPKLTSLYVWGTRVTPTGLERFKTHRPDVRVVSGLKPQDVTTEPRRIPTV
jgi:cytochrome b561